MTKDEALHKALKVLNCLNNDRVYETAWVKGAINACEEALAHPTQEPVAYFKKWEDKSGEHKDIKFSNSEGYKPLYTHPAPQPTTQEPVAWMHCVDEDITEFNDFQACPKCEPLYTHPKEWISLSDDEIIEKYIPIWGVMINARDRDETIEFARAIEAKLKEKNS